MNSVAERTRTAYLHPNRPQAWFEARQREILFTCISAQARGGAGVKASDVRQTFTVAYPTTLYGEVEVVVWAELPTGWVLLRDDLNREVPV